MTRPSRVSALRLPSVRPERSMLALASAATAYHIASKPVARARRTSMSSDWAGDLSAEVEAAVAAVQRAMRLWCVVAVSCTRMCTCSAPSTAQRPRTDGRVPLPPAATHSPATWSWQMATPPAVRRWTRVTRRQATQLGQKSHVATTFYAGSPQPASPPHSHEAAHGPGMGLQSACLRLQPGRLRLQASRSSRRATTRPSPPQTSPSKA